MIALGIHINHIPLMFKPSSQFGLQTFALALFICYAAAETVYAQSTAPATVEVPKEAPDQPQIKVLPPAYNTQMMRLSEILGSLHYLRELCGADEGQQWREQMENIIVQEAPIEERKAQMIANFNRGFRGFQETYRECTDAAIEANNRYIFEGAKLAGEIPTRFGR